MDLLDNNYDFINTPELVIDTDVEDNDDDLANYNYEDTGIFPQEVKQNIENVIKRDPLDDELISANLLTISQTNLKRALRVYDGPKNGYFSDEIINGLVKYFEDVAFDREIFLGDIDLSRTLKTKRMSLRKRQTARMLKCKVWMLPVHVYNNHFITIIVDLKKRKITYIDPLYNEKELELTEEIQQLIEDWQRSGDLKSTRQFQVSKVSYPKQYTPFDCGTIASMVLYKTLLNQEIHINYSQEEIDTYRKITVENIMAAAFFTYGHSKR